MAAPIAPSALAPPPLTDRLDRALQATADPEARRVLSALIAWKQEKSAANTAALDRAASLGETPTASPTPAAVDQDGPAGPSSTDPGGGCSLFICVSLFHRLIKKNL